MPAVDVLEGRAVRLRGGRREHVTLEGGDPVELARRFADDGCDAAARRGSRRCVLRIAVRRPARASRCCRAPGSGRWRLPNRRCGRRGARRGRRRVMSGRRPSPPRSCTRRWRRPATASSWRSMLATAGSRSTAGPDARRSLRPSSRASCAGPASTRLLVTSTTRDGSLAGPDVELLAEVLAEGAPVLAAGGIGSLDDLETVRELGCEGAVVGSALLAGPFHALGGDRACRAAREPRPPEQHRGTTRGTKPAQSRHTNAASLTPGGHACPLGEVRELVASARSLGSRVRSPAWTSASATIAVPQGSRGSSTSRRRAPRTRSRTMATSGSSTPSTGRTPSSGLWRSASRPGCCSSSTATTATAPPSRPGSACRTSSSRPPSGHPARGRRGQALPPLAGGRSLVARGADARRGRGDRDERVLHRRARRRPACTCCCVSPRRAASSTASTPSTCSSGTARGSAGPKRRQRCARRSERRARGSSTSCRESRGSPSTHVAVVAVRTLRRADNDPRHPQERLGRLLRVPASTDRDRIARARYGAAAGPARAPGRTSRGGAFKPASRTGGLIGSASGAAPNEARTCPRVRHAVRRRPLAWDTTGGADQRLHLLRRQLLPPLRPGGPRDRLVHQRAAEIVHAGGERLAHAVRPELHPRRLHVRDPRVQRESRNGVHEQRLAEGRPAAAHGP